jgi:hypothetical protein
VKEIPVGILAGFVLLSGCSLTPKQQQILERGSRPPGSVGYPIGRSVEENGVSCHYSNGTVVHRQNRAASCF